MHPFSTKAVADILDLLNDRIKEVDEAGGTVYSILFQKVEDLETRLSELEACHGKRRKKGKK